MDETKKRVLGIGIIAAIAVLTIAFAIAASGSGVLEQNAEGVTVAASEVTSSISYQGRLADSAGEPLSGTYSMTFNLYEVVSGGTALDTDTHSVEVTEGLFNTNIDFDQSYFDGRELWLGIIIEGEEMSPRQELRPVPYALSLRPGAVINGSVSGSVLKIDNTGTGEGVHGVYGETSGNWGWASGVYGKAINDYAIGVTGRNTGSGAGVYGWSDEGPGVIGTSDNDTGMYGIGKYGGYFTTNQGGTSWNNWTAGVNVTTAHDYSDGVHASTSGCVSPGVRVYTSGREGYGVYVYTTGRFSDGFRAHTHSNGSNGVYVETSGDLSRGVSAQTTGDNSDGVRVHTGGDNSAGVYAYSAKSYGVYGKGGKYGGYFTTNQDEGTGIYAHGGSSGYAAVFRGNVKITSQSSGATIMELGEGLDYAEGFDVSDLTKINPGSVLIIDPDNPGKLTLSNTPYDSKVAGIVAGANETGSGVRLGADQFDYDVALAGRVYCNVDATEEGVDPGDMLTTSATIGYAMKSTDYMRSQGAILGKAMQRLEKGEKGQILVLVTLQ